MRLRIREAIAKANENGKGITQTMLAQKIWTQSTQSTQLVNMHYLLSGRTDRVKCEWVTIICETCGCTPNFLFGYGEI